MVLRSPTPDTSGLVLVHFRNRGDRRHDGLHADQRLINWQPLFGLLSSTSLANGQDLKVTTRSPGQYNKIIQEKFGTEIKVIGLERMQKPRFRGRQAGKGRSQAMDPGATAVVEPTEEEIIKSCKLALAFEKLLDEEAATVMTAECYRTMYRPLCQDYAFPCIGFTRLMAWVSGASVNPIYNASGAHHLSGAQRTSWLHQRSTVDESNGSIILAHCLGTRKMDGPDGPAAPYKLRCIMEHQEGVVPQVKMRTGMKVTQAKLVGLDQMPYLPVRSWMPPDIDRGCRTKITVCVDGDVTSLWKNWSYGLHRVTCYGDITKELEHFCRFMNIQMSECTGRPIG